MNHNHIKKSANESESSSFRKMIAMLIFLFIISFPILPQARINTSATDIINEFYYKGIKTDFAKDGTKFLYYSDKSVTVAYYLNSDDYCTSTVIIPHNLGVLNFYCEKFNKEAVIISDMRWKQYQAKGILYIELIYADDGSYYFRLF
jgi:hypothetical protein